MASVRHGSPADQEERDKNRAFLKTLHREHQEIQVHMQTLQRGLEQMAREKAELHELLGRTRAEMQNENSRQKSEFQGEIARMHADFQTALQKIHGTNRDAEVSQMRSEFQSLTQNMQQLHGINRDAESRMKTEMKTLTQNHQALMAEVQGTKRSVDQENQKLQQEIRHLKDGHGSRQDISVLRDKTHEHQQELNRLKQGTQSKHELTGLQAQTDLTTMEFRTLRKQIYDRGLLAPKVEVVEEEERPPVGTIALGEDVFTARLLLRLGLMRAKSDEKRKREMSFSAGEDEGDDPDSEVVLFQNDIVTGLEVPEAMEGSRGYIQLTRGWTVVCVATFVVQCLALLVMLRHGLDGENECLKAPPTDTRWWLLHVSKALAMIVAGGIMGKDLMDTVNYWMVSELLEPRNMEVCLSAALRASLTLIITAANIVIFMKLTNPADVWLNMTALHFIASVGAEELDVARRGVFGHHIAKTMTTLNFQLTFVSDYPAWFRYIQGMVAMISGGVIMFFATWVFLAADYMCEGVEGVGLWS